MANGCLLAESGIQILLEDGSGCISIEQVSTIPVIYAAWWNSPFVRIGALTPKPWGTPSRAKNCPIWSSALTAIKSGNADPWHAGTMIKIGGPAPSNSKSSIEGVDPWESPSNVKRGP